MASSLVGQGCNKKSPLPRFCACAALIGRLLSGVLVVYTDARIARTFFIMAATFLGQDSGQK
jgi:FtsH-binding integral membrane protein